MASFRSTVILSGANSFHFKLMLCGYPLTGDSVNALMEVRAHNPIGGFSCRGGSFGIRKNCRELSGTPFLLDRRDMTTPALPPLPSPACHLLDHKCVCSRTGIVRVVDGRNNLVAAFFYWRDRRRFAIRTCIAEVHLQPLRIGCGRGRKR